MSAYNDTNDMKENTSKFTLDIAKIEEQDLFEDWICKYPTSKHQEITHRLQYLREYVLKTPDYDGVELFASDAAMRYYDHRDHFIKKSNLSESEFHSFEILQESIYELGLSPEPTFEFIVYVWHNIMRWQQRGVGERLEDKVKRVMREIGEHPNDDVSLEIKVGKRHYKFNHPEFVNCMMAAFLDADFEIANLLEKRPINKRETEYIFVRSALENLPIVHKKGKRGKYSQAERNFGLCLLWLVGGINHKKGDDPTELCSKSNNATFDKLMRDYDHCDVPLISESFF